MRLDLGPKQVAELGHVKVKFGSTSDIGSEVEIENRDASFR